MSAENVGRELSIASLYKKVKAVFNTLGTPNRCKISTGDCLMSGMAVYSLKVASLLQFEEDMTSDTRKKNLCKLFDIEHIPSNTYLRERLDVIDPKTIQPALKLVVETARRNRVLAQFAFLDGRYLLPIDGTTTFHHQALGAAIVHPDIQYLIPLSPEFICKQDGASKNDCERNAAKRLVDDIKQAYPDLKFIVAEDALYGNAPPHSTTRIVGHEIHYCGQKIGS